MVKHFRICNKQCLYRKCSWFISTAKCVSIIRFYNIIECCISRHFDILLTFISILYYSQVILDILYLVSVSLCQGEDTFCYCDLKIIFESVRIRVFMVWVLVETVLILTSRKCCLKAKTCTRTHTWTKSVCLSTNQFWHKWTHIMPCFWKPESEALCGQNTLHSVCP